MFQACFVDRLPGIRVAMSMNERPKKEIAPLRWRTQGYVMEA